MADPKELKIVWFLLRFGVAFVFLFASVSAFLNPTPWLSYFPDFIRSMVSDAVLIASWGSGELIIGLWILSGYRIFIPSVAASCLLLGIFMFDFYSINITFRNVSILATALSLAIMSNPHYAFNLNRTRDVLKETHIEAGDASIQS